MPLDLADATLSANADHLTLKGTIEPVCWDYAVMLSPADLRDFLKLLAKPETARFLSERGGLLMPFIVRLIVAAPGLVLKLLTTRLRAALRKGEGHAFLV